MKKLLVICGPTATGKTKLAAFLAKKIDGELISADSRQVYRGNDAETNKERPPGVRIWLYDVVDPGEAFSVSHWVKLARAAISDIRKRGKVPIIVGGTGLYIKALLEPFATIDIPPDKKLREKLKSASVKELQDMLDTETLTSMNQSDRNNPRRLIRKIETAKYAKKRESFEKAIIIGLTAPLTELYKRVDESIARGVQSNHEIVRKQLTWFKKQKDIHWFDVRSPNLVGDVLYLLTHVPED